MITYKKLLIVFPLFIHIFLLYAAPVSEDTTVEEPLIEDPRILVPGFVILNQTLRPGDFFEAICPPNFGSDAANLVITRGDVEYRVPGIAIEDELIGKYWYFYTGLDSWIGDGEYNITLNFLIDGEIVGSNSYLSYIEPRSFIREEIALNRSLTGIRTDNSDKRVKESELLSELLFKYEETSVFITGDSQRQSPLEEVFYTSTFGDRRVYLYSDGSESSSIHNGLDFRGAVGTTVSVPLPGRVSMATPRIVTGNTVIIEHLPGMYSLYYHLDSLAVSVGDFVDTGTILGKVGATGLATGSHLHWEFRIHGRAADPNSVMAAFLLDSTHIYQVISQNQ